MRLSVSKSHLFSLQSSQATVDSPRGETWPTDRSCWHRSSIKAVPWLNTILFNCNGRVWFFFLPFIWIKEVIFHRRSRLWNSFILIVLRHTALQSVYVILYMLCAPTNVFGICVITQDGGGGVHSLNVTEISRTFFMKYLTSNSLFTPNYFSTSRSFQLWREMVAWGSLIRKIHFFFLFPKCRCFRPVLPPLVLHLASQASDVCSVGFSNNNLDFWGI